MISKNIILQINNSNIQYNSNISEKDQKYFSIENKDITLFSDINYNIYFNKTSNNEIYYIIITENHKLNKKQLQIIIYHILIIMEYKI